jgi:tRNA threonylcarbamoyladenosine biosynthesis protein TsaB
MIVLALDTTTVPGSVALQCHGVLTVRVGDPLRPASQRLPGELLALLAEAGLVPADVDLFGVAVGPGSLTGLRVGIATMQGLALATGKPVAGISALEALAVAAQQRVQAPAGTLVGACMNAFRGEVYWAAFRVGEVEETRLPALREEGPPEVVSPAALRDRLAARDEPLLVSGDGVALISATASAELPALTPVAAEPLAGVLARMAAARAGRGGAGPPHAIRPLYIRRPDAEVARERAAGQRDAAPESPPASPS